MVGIAELTDPGAEDADTGGEDVENRAEVGERGTGIVGVLWNDQYGLGCQWGAEKHTVAPTVQADGSEAGE